MLTRPNVPLGAIVLVVALAGCSSPAQETRDEAKNASADVADATAEAHREKQAEVSRLTERAAGIERDYLAKTEQLTAGTKVATSGLREEVQEDVANVKEAVANLSTTTEANWWEREEAAVQRSVEDIASDVKRLAGSVPEPNPVAIDTNATAPFTSRRDAFVTATKGRVNTLRRALDPVKANGPSEAELNDTKARVDKVAEDLDKLAAASPDDWWDVTTDRIEAYLDRVEASVKRLDDHKSQAE